MCGYTVQDYAVQDYTVRLAHEVEIVCLPEVEKVAAQRFLPYLAQLEISPDLLQGLTPLSYLKKAQAENRLWVAILAAAKTQPVGFLVAKYLTDCCFVVELSVHADHGRRGIGSALIEACCEAARVRGERQVMLTTFRYVPWNIPFYQRVGFQQIGCEQWSPEISAIVRHEARYGFAPQHRAVMRRVLRSSDGRPRC